MSDLDFVAFDKIERLKGIAVTITEKIHGTNAQIAISDDGQTVKAGSRNRWLTIDDDNYGFAKWVEEKREALLSFLGPGRHFGEWYGAGIGVGYGLKEKRLALFNGHRWAAVVAEGGKLPERVDLVPVLYSGLYSVEALEGVKEKLKAGGSVLVPGYAKPEGVVVSFHEFRTLKKFVFESEETGWRRVDKEDRPPVAGDPVFDAAVNELLQPVRLEKLLMRDESYLRDFPASLPAMARDYIADLVKETSQIDETHLAGAKKKLFPFLKSVVAKTQSPNSGVEQW